MLLAMTDDLRVILVKLADRLHNMRTLEHLPEEKRRAIAAETMEIYAPLANRLGMGKIKGELEDLSFRFLHPEEHAELTAAIDERLTASAANVEKIRRDASREDGGRRDRGRGHGRVKRYWSIRQKLHRQADSPRPALRHPRLPHPRRHDSADCYSVLGIVHQAWRPVPGRIKDYIAMPKPNFYQALHTTVVPEKRAAVRGADPDPRDGPHRRERDRGALEVQGREARPAGRRGVDRHGCGSSSRRRGRSRTRGSSSRRSRSTSTPTRSTPSSPKGAVFAFPRGRHAGRFRVSDPHGRRAPLRRGARERAARPAQDAARERRHRGDPTSPSAQPSRDWLGFAATTRAKNKIRAYIHAAEKERSIEIGRRLLERELRKFRKSLPRLLEQRAFDPYLRRLRGLHGGGPPRGRRIRKDPSEVRRRQAAAARGGGGRRAAAGSVARGGAPDGGATSSSLRAGHRDQGEGGKRPARHSRRVLPSRSGRRDRRLRHAGTRGVGPRHGLSRT